MKTPLVLSAALLAAGFGPSFLVGAARAADPPQKLECINLMSIDDSPVIDEKTILLKMKGGDSHYKRIDLAAPCTGIEYNGWSHDTNYDQLCSSDTLTPRVPGGGVCKIGHIVNISDAEAKALMAKHEKK